MNRHDFYNILKAHAEKENGRYKFKVIDLKIACAEIEDAISNSHKHSVMQAEGSDGAYEAAVASEGQGEANMSADAGCPRCKSSDLLDTDDHWTHCQNCGFSFLG